MHLNRVLSLVLAATSFLLNGAYGQWNREPVCTATSGDYLACALYAGHVPDLRDAIFAPGEREVRFWTVSGAFFPDQVLLIHQRGDTVTGKLLLIWSDSTVSDTFAKARCSDQSWLTASGSLCIGRLAAVQDWASVLRDLDARGLSQLPGSPVPEEPCDRRPIPARPGELPRDRICRFVTDGFSHSLEVRTSTVYWRYDFQQLPDTTAPGLKRDQAILQTLTCAAFKFGDGPCVKGRAP